MAIKDSISYIVYRISYGKYGNRGNRIAPTVPGLYTKYEIPYTKYSARSAGFTLIELLAVMAILVVVTGAILTSNARFGGAVLLQNLAYDMGLTIRQAQIYGISVRRFSANDFSSGYGMHFEISSPTTYVLFADAVAKNGLYDQGELVEATDIGRGYRIADLCIIASGATSETCGIEKIDILFKRPEPDAYIRANGASGINERGRIAVESPRGDRMSIVVEATGQIAVQ